MEWRIKQYYDPRVLIEVSDVLQSEFSDCVVCLTGAQLCMLRNLCQYLERRVTFVSEYREKDYLAPTEAEWNDIQYIVADLEDTLMDCEQFTAKLEEILEAALTAAKGSGKGYTSDVISPIYDDLEDDGVIEWANPDGTPIPAVDDRCALAQLVYAWNYEFLTEVLQPIQEALHEILLFAALAAIVTWIGGPILLLPGAVLYHIIQAALDAWVEGMLQNVLNALMANKYALVCTMFNTWVDGGNYQDAAIATGYVINDVEAWSETDKSFFWLTFTPIIMKLMQTAWTEQTPWALANVTAGYCDECEYGGGPTSWYRVHAPPCPGPCTLGAHWSCSPEGYWRTRIQFGGVSYLESPVRIVAAGTVDVHIVFDIYSFTSGGWFVGTAHFQKSTDLLEWTEVGNVNIYPGQQEEWVWHDHNLGEKTFTETNYVRLLIGSQEYQYIWKYYRTIGWYTE